MSSARGYYSNDRWDLAAWVDVIAIEYETLVGVYPFDDVFRSLGGDLELLDVGCGTAIFPGYLDPILSEDVHLRADLLDISEASLVRASEVLTTLDHFTVGDAYQTQIEDLPDLGDDRYHVVWAIHSLTTVDRDRMPASYDRLMGSVKPGGYLYIYQLTAGSAYQRVHRLYRAARGGNRYMEFEDTVNMFDAAGYQYEVVELAFDHVVPDRSLEKYLHKVTLDDTVSVELFEPMLTRLRDDGVVRFPQTVNLIAAHKPD
jgi:SAM-dependent methyltransferase